MFAVLLLIFLPLFYFEFGSWQNLTPCSRLLRPRQQLQQICWVLSLQTNSSAKNSLFTTGPLTVRLSVAVMAVETNQFHNSQD